MITIEELERERDEKLRSITDHFGLEHQLNKLGEEVGEFANACTAFYNDPTDANWQHIIEELADIEVVLDQFKLRLHDDAMNEGRLFFTMLASIKGDKIQRTCERIEDGYYDKER